MKADEKIKIALAQIAPIWLDKKATTEKIIEYLRKAAEEEADLIVFSETILPGYPFWISLSDGARFDSALQKEMHSLYLEQAVCIENGDLDDIQSLCKEFSIACYLGILERPLSRGGHSVYCALVYINKEGVIASVHRKLMPTYEERLSWAVGDGNGLKVHKLGAFSLGGLNCWENWMPLPRTALYAMGEDVHIAVWPGSKRNTIDISRFIALESRSYVVSVSGFLSKKMIPSSLPVYSELMEHAPDVLADGGSCIAAPDGSWLIEPVSGKECLLFSEIHHAMIRRERQNFDPSGHYSRPDVLQLQINAERQSVLKSKD